MTTPAQAPPATGSIGIVMFTVADPDAAQQFYVDVLGFEVRADVRFGEHGENRWLEVAPPGSATRLALNPPMGSAPGGGGLGIEVADVRAEHARLSAVDGLDLDPLVEVPGAPLLFMLRDPDGNSVVVVQPPAG